MFLLDLRLVSYFLGKIAFALGTVLLIPLLYGLARGESIEAFVIAFCLTWTMAGILYQNGHLTAAQLSLREGMAITGLGWIMATLLGMLPFLAGGYLGPLDSVFESISGFTGTGATVIDNLESLPQNILLWRMMTHWLGGLGIIDIFLALLPQSGHGAVHMYNAEMNGPAPDRVLPRLREMAMVLFFIYCAFTLLAALVYLLLGMAPFDAVAHALSTIATGGFSIYDTNAIHFDNAAIEGWMTFFMVLSGVNFGLYYRAYKDGPRVFLQNTEFKGYVAILVLSTVFIAYNLMSGLDYDIGKAFRYATFQVASISTTGFVSDDFDSWPSFSKYLLLLLMVSGGCTGSTAGGLKVSRLIMLLKISSLTLWQQFNPRRVSSIRMNGEDVSDTTLHRVCQFFFVYMMFIVLWALLLTADGISMFDAIGISISTMGSVGPGFGIVGATCTYSGLSDYAKTILCFSMLLGRLEIFTLLALLSPHFWRQKKGW